MKIRIRWGSRAPAAPAEVHPRIKAPLSISDEAVTEGIVSPAVAPPEPGIIEKLMIEAYGASNVGCVRTNNEDYFLIAPSIGLYVVADGMGGAQAGEHASKLAVETLVGLMEKLDPSSRDRSTVSDALVDAFEEANRRVMDAASSDPSLEGMGTTLIAAMECDGGLVVASVGDSRGYQSDNGALKLITEDQTWVNEVGRRLGLEEESLKTHPMRHVLTMAIGVSEQLRVHTYQLHLRRPAHSFFCAATACTASRPRKKWPRSCNPRIRSKPSAINSSPPPAPMADRIISPRCC